MSVARFVREIRKGAPTAAETELALAALRVADGIVSKGGDGMTLERASLVTRLDDGVYEGIPTRHARIRVLSLSSARAEGPFVVRVVVGGERTHVARAIVDAPRRVLRAVGLPSAEPGDRFGDGFTHRFFDEEALLEEIHEAGLVIVKRSGATFVVDRGVPPEEAPASFAIELARAARLAPLAERYRFDPPASAVRAMRRLGSRHPARGPIGRARLRRAIGWVDALHPAGPICYRRVLLELGLDRGAAEEAVVFGLDVGRTGHVAFKETSGEDRVFDVAFEIAP